MPAPVSNEEFHWLGIINPHLKHNHVVFEDKGTTALLPLSNRTERVWFWLVNFVLLATCEVGRRERNSSQSHCRQGLTGYFLSSMHGPQVLEFLEHWFAVTRIMTLLKNGLLARKEIENTMGILDRLQPDRTVYRSHRMARRQRRYDDVSLSGARPGD